MAKFKYFYLTALTILLFSARTSAQTIPISQSGQEDHFRREQLSGRADSNISFTIRPLSADSLSEMKYERYSRTTGTRLASGLPSGTVFRILPFGIQNQFNSHHAYGWNDGSLIPAKGFQTIVSGGVYAEYGLVSVQIKPEFVYAANPTFEEFPQDHFSIIWARYYNFYNNIDLPVRFGDKPYAILNPGQSSVRLNYKDLSLGISSENLWWGPGMRNSLTMSNSAPGFLHLTLNTQKPIKTPVGTLEGQIIAGRLEGSGFFPPDTSYRYQGTTLYQPKSKDWRYLSGLVLTVQPKWTPGLFLGLSRTSQFYSKNLNSVGDYLPFFSSFKGFAADESQETPDRYTSFFARYLWKESKAEVYMEYGHNGQSGSLSDFVENPSHGRAYIFGFRKLFPLAKRSDESILAGIEVTQLAQQAKDIFLNAGSWYIDKNVRHGYTHKGEALGAGIGPGGNLQSFDLSWVKGIKVLGIRVERYTHNDDFYYYAYDDSDDWRRHWTDLSFAARGEWDYKNFVFNANLNFVRSLNYGWYLLQAPTDPYYVKGRDVSNVQLRFGLTYRFKD